MDLDLRILMKMQSEINYLIVNRDLTHLPKVAILLKQYCSLNDIDEEELEKLIRLSEKYGC